MTEKAMKIDQLLERLDRPITEYWSFYHRQAPSLEFEIYAVHGEGPSKRTLVGFMPGRFWADVAVATLTSYRDDMKALLS